MSKVQVDTIVDKDDISAPSLTKGAIVTGVCTATSFDGAISEWVLGANGSSDYTFTGSGLTGAENDPTLYLKRGQKYRFKNSSGGHPFRIQSTANGSTGTAYNDGVTNNDAGNGTTLEWDVQFDAPSVLYYQCTSHGSMGGKIYIGNSGNSATLVDLNVSGVTTTGIATVTTSVVVGTGVTINNTGIDVGNAGIVTAGTVAAPDAMALKTSGSERLHITSGGLVRIGASTDEDVHTGEGADLQVVSTDGGGLTLARDDSTVSNGANLGVIRAYGNDADGTYQEVAKIEFQADLNHGTGDKPGRLVFSTTPDGNTAPAEAFRVNSDQKLLVAHTSSHADMYGKIQVASDTSQGIDVARYTANAHPPYIRLYKSRNGTTGGNTIVQDGDTVGYIDGSGNDGSGFHSCAAVAFQVDGTPGDDDMPGRIVFETVSDGGITITERLRIGSAGQLGIAGANYGTSGQVLTSQGASAAPSWADAGGGGGLTEIDAWCLSSAWPTPSSGSTWSNVRLGNASNTAGTGTFTRNTEHNMPIGTGVVNTNGLFTFPSTGTYEVTCQLHVERYYSTPHCTLDVVLSATNAAGSGITLAAQSASVSSDCEANPITMSGIFKVTNTGTQNVWVKMTVDNYIYIIATSKQNMIFKKLT